jgi:hypothetical protein
MCERNLWHGMRRDAEHFLLDFTGKNENIFSFLYLFGGQKNLNGYFIVQLSRRKPELWGNEKLCKNSIHFDVNMWKEKKSDLKRFKKMLMNSKYLVEHVKSYKMRFFNFYYNP